MRLISTACIGAILLALGTSVASAQLGKGAAPLGYTPKGYPDWHSQWQNIDGISWLQKGTTIDDVPLTKEGRAVYDDGKKMQAKGMQGNDPTYRCIPPGMPRAMTVVYPMEIMITPQVTYIAIEYANQLRRIYTDGRDWPEAVEPQFSGYSLGKWEDTNADGTFDTLLVETRHMKGPRAYDSDGIPLHPDNETVVFEKIYIDPQNPDRLLDEVTTKDSFLTKPWTVTKQYKRERNPVWFEYVCAEDNNHVQIGSENYFVAEDGLLMPTYAGQKAPDMSRFKAD